MILIVSHSNDAAPSLVTRHLESWGCQYLLLNTDELGTKKYHFGFDTEATLFADEVCIKKSMVRAIWFRRFATPRSLEAVDDKYSDFVKRELNVCMDSFLEANPALQINPYMVDRLAGNRLIQAQRAKACGFRVPETIVTQDERAARHFIDSGRTITKALSFGRLSIAPGKEMISYCEEVSSRADFGGLEYCPALFQELIGGRFDWRVTVVGTKIFAARCQRGADRAIDWRDISTVPEFERATLPEAAERRILDLTKNCALIYAAHDLVETMDGEFVFLETNPAGQWGWLELSLDMPVGEAIAAELRNAVCESN